MICTAGQDRRGNTGTGRFSAPRSAAQVQDDLHSGAYGLGAVLSPQVGGTGTGWVKQGDLHGVRAHTIKYVDYISPPYAASRLMRQ